MTDRVYPASKLNPPPSQTMNGNTTTPATNGAANQRFPAAKSQLYNPNRPRLTYRPQPRESRRCSCRRFCCLCFLYTLIFLLCLALLVAIAACICYVLYHPKHPTFSVSSLRISSFNLSSADPTTSYSHVTSRVDVVLSAKNPNKKLSFFYDPFTVSLSSGSVDLGNGSFPAFTSAPGNDTIMRSKVSSDPAKSQDSDSATELRSDLSKNNGFPIGIQLDTRVNVKMGKLKSKKSASEFPATGSADLHPKKAAAKRRRCRWLPYLMPSVRSI
ncbi:hypothetical protein Nepgr_000953 [Nepenthes gracilis]|uniref:Late embryogenesis abundant protein LEA-2 subgroup domain-containing protein n=1 Tax=Nepenthes gracilis TaxID=150966 RepID=A0AAD3P3N9_NEPGR|nr:hypothetical protein Nepgr_000953 [Nepenthes gracilis]